VSIKISVFGVKETSAFLTKKKVKTNINIKNAMEKAGLFLDSEVKQSIAGHRAEPASVDTGNFLRSVTSKASDDNAIVYSDVPYAQYLEYGTSKINARRHFNNSKDRNKNKVKEIINSEVKKM